MAQSAVRRLPRLALWLFCLAYVLPGFLGRGPWRNADMQAFGYMFELASGRSAWWYPTLLGQPPEFDALLPYWLGAWAIQLFTQVLGWFPADLAARLVFAALLGLTLVATWYAVYHLARSPRAQPVAFAFGGEADPTDYARALADAGLLALIACLGLAQFSHETTPSLAQLAFTALAFYGLAAGSGRPSGRASRSLPALALGLGGLALSGAPSLAVLMAGAGLVAWALEARALARQQEDEATVRAARWRTLQCAAALVAVAALATALGLWRWRLGAGELNAGSAARLLLWFTWPVGPLAAWTVWRWRHQIGSRHLVLPLLGALLPLASALGTANPDRSLLLALPSLAALAAFSLPTLRRVASSLIDWFTLLFFTGGALIIWGVWISLETGVPRAPAANVARLAPGFEHAFSPIAFAVALAGTLAWAWLVRWRVGRHRAALWKSLVLPAGGAALCWMLLMTLWLPALDYARSYVPIVAQVQRAVDGPGCVEAVGLSRGHVAALRYHGHLDLAPSGTAGCRWRVQASPLASAAASAADTSAATATTPAQPAAATPRDGTRAWTLVTTVRRPADAKDRLYVYRASAP